MPAVVEIIDDDSETLTAVKLMIHDMIDYTPSRRLPLDQVQSTLEAKIGEVKLILSVYVKFKPFKIITGTYFVSVFKLY